MDEIGERTCELFHGQAQLYKLMYLWMSSSCLKCATDLEIPGVIHKHGQPIPLSQLVSALNVPPSKATFVKGLMRLLAHNGLFAISKSNTTEEESEEAYDLTPASKLLVNGTDLCLCSMVHLAVSPALFNLYHNLGKWVCGQENTLRGTSSGLGTYDFLTQNPADLAAFQEAMASDSRFMKVALRDLESVFDGLSYIVDVGGGNGTTAKIISEAFPKLKCTVLDLPEVVADLSENTNVTFVGGDMLKSIPNADAVLIKWVLHDWGDDDCIKILKNAKEAISGNGRRGKVIIIDTVLNEKEDQKELLETKLLFNIVLAAEFKSKERTEEEWKELFLKAGFTDYQIFPIFGFRSLIVLNP
ncbi:isoflavone-7-O-methyltransferase 9-like isoform X1 [Prosopis cineraria]|uniref:isoflavone-7-O-methyltransferase 9-like isoform X1 n=1 Tax=Prosopis cineraria TaxID=364024 RepID=UPI0024107905|nr:isoflavone-7-O-methyltransferase 9-like isoform X1 [Prosopis cineraria]